MEICLGIYIYMGIYEIRGYKDRGELQSDTILVARKLGPEFCAETWGVDQQNFLA